MLAEEGKRSQEIVRLVNESDVEVAAIEAKIAHLQAEIKDIKLRKAHLILEHYALERAVMDGRNIPESDR